jgi:alpha-N-arabinofuranosidase
MAMDEFIRTVICICDTVKGKKHSKKQINLSVDEWNVWYHSNGDYVEKWSQAPHQLEDYYNFEDALLVGLMLMTLLKHADRVKVACLAQLVNVIAPTMTENNGGIFEQTIFYPIMHLSNNARGSVLESRVECDKHDTKEFTDVPDMDAIATISVSEDEIVVFAVNRCQTEDYLLDVNMLDVDGYKLCEHIEMAGFKATDGNNFVSAPVKPSNREITDGEIKIKPFSWNVLKFKK